MIIKLMLMLNSVHMMIKFNTSVMMMKLKWIITNSLMMKKLMCMLINADKEYVLNLPTKAPWKNKKSTGNTG